MFTITIAQRRRGCWGCTEPTKKDTVCIEAYLYHYSKSFHIPCLKRIVDGRVLEALNYERYYNKKGEQNG